MSGLGHLKVQKQQKNLVRPQGSMFTRDIFWERQNEIKPWHCILFLSPKSSPFHDHFYCYRNASQKDAADKSQMKDWLISEKDIWSLWEIRHITEKTSCYIPQSSSPWNHLALQMQSWARPCFSSFLFHYLWCTDFTKCHWMDDTKIKMPMQWTLSTPNLLQITQRHLWKAASEEYRGGFKTGELQQESWMKSYFKLNNRIFNIVPMLPGSDLPGKKTTQYFSF